MRHSFYGNLPHIYYHNKKDLYYVRFRRQGQFFLSPYYKTVEEAIEARKIMQNIVPKPISKKTHTCVKVCNYLHPTWYLSKYLNGEPQFIANTNLANLKRSVQGKTKRFKNRQEQIALQDNDNA